MNRQINEDTSTRGVYILPRLNGLGGPASFRGRLIRGLKDEQVIEVDSIDDPCCRAVLVIGGTRDIPTLIEARRKGLRVVQRLNGMNWIHRKIRVQPVYFLRCEVNNQLLRFIRHNLADRIVYQSQFASKWWQTVYGSTRASSSVAYNGVDLNEFSPEGPETRPADHYRLLMVEAHIGGGYERGLDTAVKLTQLLNQQCDRPVRLTVAGNVPDHLKAYWSRQSGGMVDWAGVVPNDRIAGLDRSAHLLFSADLNAACPNAVIEAMACGLPVLAFATGSLPEIISRNAGQVVPYGSNYWNLEPPDIQQLAIAGLDILTRQETYRQPARRRAVEEFSLARMVKQYMSALFD
ncbi:MAG: glycosyltransferase family 4 protein [Leptolinea sp.]|nr:glycosyltransferase family 4 protein [Leptolinea sp.]